MKNIFLIFLSCIGLANCGTTSTMKFSGNETLIRLNYKLPQYGYFTFLFFVNENEVNEIIYYYSININNKTYSCSKASEKVYNTNEYCKQKYCNIFKTAEEFRNSLHNSLLEKYFSCFINNFLDMTNDEKIDLLNRLTK